VVADELGVSVGAVAVEVRADEAELIEAGDVGVGEAGGGADVVDLEVAGATAAGHGAGATVAGPYSGLEGGADVSGVGDHRGDVDAVADHEAEGGVAEQRLAGGLDRVGADAGISMVSPSCKWPFTSGGRSARMSISGRAEDTEGWSGSVRAMTASKV